MLRRAAIIIFIGAGIPLAVLSWLALQSISTEANEEKRLSEERAANAAKAVADRFDESIAHAEQALVVAVRDALARAATDPLGDEDPDALVANVPPLNARGRAVASALESVPTDGLVRETFLASGGGRLLAPRLARYPVREPDPGDKDLVRSVRLPESNRDSDLALADTALYHVLTQCRDEDLRAYLRWEQAELALRRGDLDGALEHLRQARARPAARDLDGRPVFIAATQRFVEVAPILGRRDDALAATVELVLALAEDRWQMDEGERKSIFDAAVGDARLLLEELGAREAPPGVLRTLEKALTRASFLDGFEERILPELRRRAHAPPQGETFGPMVRAELGLNALGELRLFAACALEGAVAPATPVASARGHGRALVGLELDLDALRERLAADVASVQSTSDARIAVVDATGATFAGDDGVTKGGAITARPLLDALSGWRVLAAPRDPGAPAERAARVRVQLGALVAVCALAVLLALFLTLRAAAHELEVAKVRGDLVRNVSHELRTPVASILMLSEVLEDGGLDEAKQKEYFGRISREARRLARLIEHVLDLSKVERGARKIEPIDSLLGESARRCVDAFRESEEGRGANVVFEDSSGDAVLPIDAVALEQVLANLISNAIKYSPEGAPVTVRVSATDTEGRIVVRDQGRGLTPEEQRRLFAPFYRARPEDGSAHGVGLGLVITRELVRLHGGRLELESAPGKGSAFAVVLPRGPARGKLAT